MIKRPSVPGDIWFVAQQIAYFKNLPVCKVLESNRENVSDLYGIPIWRPSSLPPLKGYFCVASQIFASRGKIALGKNKVGNLLDSLILSPGMSPLVKKRVPLNSRSLMKIVSGTQLSAHFPAKERRSTSAREIFLALT